VDAARKQAVSQGKERLMEDLVVARLWMAGVVAVMLTYGAIAIIGSLKNK